MLPVTFFNAIINREKKRSRGKENIKISVHLRTLASSWYGISGTPLAPIHLLAKLDMAARLDRLVGLVRLSRDLLSLDGYTVPCHATPFEYRRSSRCHLEIAHIRLTIERRVKLEYKIRKNLVIVQLGADLSNNRQSVLRIHMLISV